MSRYLIDNDRVHYVNYYCISLVAQLVDAIIEYIYLDFSDYWLCCS